MHAGLSAPVFRASQQLREVVGTTAMAGAWHEAWHEAGQGARSAEGWADIWPGMPPSSGESQRMRRAMRASGVGALVAEHVRLGAERLRHIDYSTDLGADIGSVRWWRGFALMLALSASALAFWPGFSPPLPAKPHRQTALSPDMPSRDIFATGAAMDADAPAPATPRHPAAPHPQISLVTTLADGDSYSEMLQRVGVSELDAEQVSALMAAAIPMGEMAPGASFTLSLDADGAHALQRVEFRTRTDLVVAIERRGASFELGTRGSIAPPPPMLSISSLPQPVASAPGSALVMPPPPVASGPSADATPLRIRGTVGASLYRSARAAGAPAAAVQQYLQVVGAHMAIADLRADDTFDIIVGNASAGRGRAQTGDLLYAGLEHNGHARAELVRWGKGGQFFDASAQPMAQASVHLLMPVIGKITSGFGMRVHPILGFTRMHEGIDLSAPYGAPIYAVAPGVVAYAGMHGGHGRYVRLEHSGGLGTGYAHMSRIAVASGTHVRAGQVIGYVGSSGLSTGAHLHYEVYRGGETVNPMTARFSAAVRAAVPRNLGALRARLATLLRVKPGVAGRAGKI